MADGAEEPLEEPLSQPDAEKLAKQIVRTGSVAYSQHARDEMAKDDLTAIDIENVLRGGYCDDRELKNGSWRYRMRTQRIVSPICFRSRAELVVVTAWRVVR